jgi:hypothetical protein
MMTPFKALEEEVFPKVHSYVAHNSDETQNTLAGKLGITQAMVSKYRLKKPESSPIVEKIGSHVIDGTKNGLSKEELNAQVTNLCIGLMQAGELCPICSMINGFSSCNVCMNLGINNKSIIENINQAVKILENNNPLDLMPEVSINIAMSRPDAKTKAEIASVPGRIVKINDKLKASNPPMFNSSNHLAELLLKTKKTKPEINAIMNIKYDGEIDRQITKSGIKNVIIDRGSFGIEPCCYIFGKDAVDVAEKAVNLQEGLR